jgi:hypothetical protein
MRAQWLAPRQPLPYQQVQTKWWAVVERQQLSFLLLEKKQCCKFGGRGGQDPGLSLTTSVETFDPAVFPWISMWECGSIPSALLNWYIFGSSFQNWIALRNSSYISRETEPVIVLSARKEDPKKHFDLDTSQMIETSRSFPPLFF